MKWKRIQLLFRCSRKRNCTIKINNGIVIKNSIYNKIYKILPKRRSVESVKGIEPRKIEIQLFNI